MNSYFFDQSFSAISELDDPCALELMQHLHISGTLKHFIKYVTKTSIHHSVDIEKGNAISTRLFEDLVVLAVRQAHSINMNGELKDNLKTMIRVNYGDSWFFDFTLIRLDLYLGGCVVKAPFEISDNNWKDVHKIGVILTSDIHMDDGGNNRLNIT